MSFSVSPQQTEARRGFAASLTQLGSAAPARRNGNAWSATLKDALSSSAAPVFKPTPLLLHEKEALLLKPDETPTADGERPYKGNSV